MKTTYATWCRSVGCAALVLFSAAGAAAQTRGEGGSNNSGAAALGEAVLRGGGFGETYGFGKGVFEVVGFPDRETGRARIRIQGTGAMRVDRVRINDQLLYPYDDYTVSAGGGTSDVTVNFLRGARPRPGDVVEISGRTQTRGEHGGRLQFLPGTQLPRDVERELAARGRAGAQGDFNRPRTGDERRTTGLSGGPPRVRPNGVGGRRSEDDDSGRREDSGGG